MRWEDWPSRPQQHVRFYDLMQDKQLLGYVKVDTRCNPPEIWAIANHTLRGGDFRVMAPTVEEAKAQLIHHFVLQRLEDT
jgi:hypothetical protein